MDKPGTRTPTWYTPEQKRIAELEELYTQSLQKRKELEAQVDSLTEEVAAAWSTHDLVKERLEKALASQTAVLQDWYDYGYDRNQNERLLFGKAALEGDSNED